MATWWHTRMVRLTYWMLARYVTTELAFHHSVVTWVWYPFIVQHVRKAATSGLSGTDKRDVVVTATRERFRARGLPMPPLGDVHLAIEYAVRDHAH